MSEEKEIEELELTLPPETSETGEKQPEEPPTKSPTKPKATKAKQKSKEADPLTDPGERHIDALMAKIAEREGK